MVLKGLAQCSKGQEDRDLLKPDWWYNWGVGDLSDPTFVPMLYNGYAESGLPFGYSGYVLVFNEPNNPSPFGCDVPYYPESVTRYAVLANLYPHAKFIVGGVSAWDWSWIVSFHKMAVRCHLRLPVGYAIHGYANDYGTLTQMFSWWKYAHDKIKTITSASEFWVTETSDMHGNPSVLETIYNKIVSYNFERMAVYTNQQPEGANYAIDKRVDLVKDNNLTPLGIKYTEL